MQPPVFVYTTYIRTSADRLWQALTDPTLTKRYWGTEFTTEWHTGDEMTWRYADVTVADPSQVVLESDPPRRLSYTWQTISEEFARAVGFTEEYLAEVRLEPRSRVAFDLEATGGVIKLTVTHDGFEYGSKVFESISEGWPFLLSSLKSLLETDLALDFNLS